MTRLALLMLMLSVISVSAQDSKFEAAALDEAAIAAHSRAFATQGSATQPLAARRQQALEGLLAVYRLTSQSQLYSDEVDLLASLQSPAARQDWLAQQRARMQVLAGYAASYLTVLDAQSAVPMERALLREWAANIAALKADAAGLSGPVMALEALYAGPVPELLRAGCDQGIELDRLPARMTEPADDLFSDRRSQLLVRAWRLPEQCYVAFREHDHQLAHRFNRELAGRKPIASQPAPAAAAETLRAFLDDYQRERQSLRLQLGLWQPEGSEKTAITHFLDGLDAALAADDSFAPDQPVPSFAPLP